MKIAIVTCATYNENGGWNNSDELDLLKFLDRVHTLGKKFALSNVLHKNKILLEWLDKNSDIYHVVHLKHSYANSNYHKTDKNSASDEVLIVNYNIERAG